jgi:signal transduction histidine kinase
MAYLTFCPETDVRPVATIYSPLMRHTFRPPRQPAFDVALAVGVAVAGVVEVTLNPALTPRPAAYVCEVLLGLTLLGRRRFPVLTLVVVTLLSVVESLAGVPVDQPWVPLLAIMAAAYTVSLHAELEMALLGISVAALGFAVEAIDQHKGFGNIAFGLTFTVPVFAAGRAVRMRTVHAETLEREQDEQARAAVEAERRRITRDLHDVISHSLGVVVLQAGAAEQVLTRDPDKARELLGEIRTTGQRAVAELGALLTLARTAPVDSLEPSPSLDELTHLADTMGRAGLEVIVRFRGTRRPLPTAVEVSAYRIVQEALTNAARHSGGRQAVVTLSYEPAALDIEVLDDGAGGSAAPGTRRGLVGMRERAALFGGSVEVGPAPQGGWRVGATLPVPR